MMPRRAISPLIAGAFAAAAIAAVASGTEVPRAAQTLVLPNSSVEIVFRALQPGEAILAGLVDRDANSVRSAAVRLSGREWTLTAARPFALFGLDLDLPAAPLPLGIDEVRANGETVKLAESLVIEAKEFSRRRFRVNQTMLTPPAAETERVKREQELVQAVFGIITPDWLGEGAFVAPLAQEPFQNFGQRRVYNGKTTSIHAGVDIGAPYGAAIRASNSGRIVLASRLYLSGWTVIIDHGQGVFTFYGHCSKFLVKRGDAVRKGQVIARVGNTGRSTGPHLHWAARIAASRVDPFSLLALALED
jgi:hypothetical protein